MMSEIEENVQILKKAYSLWNDSKADSMEHWMNLISDGVSWRSISNGCRGMEFSKSCQCKDEVVQYFGTLVQDWEMIHYTIDEFIAQGDRVVAIGNCGWKHKRTGRKVETPKADVIRMKDGKIVEFFEFFDSAQAVAASDAEDK